MAGFQISDLPTNFGKGLSRIWKVRDYLATLGNAFDASTGHDHSGAGLGKPIPAGGLGSLAVTTGKINTGAVTTPKIAAQAVDYTVLARGAVDDLFPAPRASFEFALPDQASGNVDFVIGPAFRVTNVRFIALGTNGAVANTWRAMNGTGGASPITDAVSFNAKVAGDIVNPVSLLNRDIAAAGVLRFTNAKVSGVCSGRAIVEGYLIP